jgi:hypothetical protein
MEKHLDLLGATYLLGANGTIGEETEENVE